MNEGVTDGPPSRDSEETLSYFLGFEELVTSISTQLINLASSDIDAVIDEALARLGEFAGVDRSYVFVISHERETMTNTHEWCAPGIEPQIANVQNLPNSQLPWLMQRLNRLESIPIASVADLPDEAAAEKEIFESQDIQSIILVPMAFDQNLYGFLGFDAVRSSKEWPERTIGLLRIVGEMIVNALERKRTEEILRESELRHRQLVELMPDLVLLHEDGVIRFINSAGVRLLGASSPAELIGRPVLSIVHPDDRDGVSERIGSILSDGKTVEAARERFVTMGGDELVVEVNASRFPVEGERVILVVARDVGERDRAARAVERSLSLLKATLESTANGILVVNLEGEIQTYNRRVSQIWKIDEDLLASGSDASILKAALQSVKNPSGFSDRWRQLHNNPQAVTRELLEMKDGRVVEQYTMPQLLDGEPVGRVWSFRDVTEQRNTEEALLDSVERYRLLFERNLAGVYRNTIDGKFLDCNEACARILGYSSRDELMGTNAIDAYYDPSDRDVYVEDLLERGVVTNTEVCLKKKDGSPVWVLENATLLDSPEGGMPTVEGTLIDISEIKRAEALLQESEERYRLMAQYSTDMIARLTPDWIFMYVSPASTAILGYVPTDLIGRSIEDLVHPDDRLTTRSVRESVIEKEDVITVSYRIRGASGAYVWLESTCRPIYGPDGREVLEIISVSRDISERREAQARIEYQAYHDPLTGLPNRMLFLDRLTVALSHANRTGLPVSVMFFDLDNFKFINDTLGHSVGDALLQGVARRLRSITRGEDTVSRMGGDEFTLISEVQNVDDASRIAEKILHVIARPFEIEGQELYVTTSIGISIYPDDGEDEDTLLKSADGAMYRAKSLGRNNYQLCTPEMNEKAMERLTLERDLRGALERKELLLHYQPQFDLRTGKILGLEALLRWEHPTRGMIPPASFIPVAEDTRLIFEIGEWVLHQACEHARDWQIAGLGNIRVAVNLSARQFQHRGLVSVVAGILDRTALMPELLELEITESMAVHNTEWSLKMIEDFRSMGLRISMDDFGTGYSSLNYLRQFKIDTLKIDREFLLDIPGKKSSSTIVAAIIRMARGFDMQVIAEGVETESQREFLEREGCHGAQGFLFSKPLPVDELTVLLRSQRSDMEVRDDRD